MSAMLTLAGALAISMTAAAQMQVGVQQQSAASTDTVDPKTQQVAGDVLTHELGGNSSEAKVIPHVPGTSTGGQSTLTVIADGVVHEIDVTCTASIAGFGDPNNVAMSIDLGANAHVTDIGWDVQLEAFAPSWLSEMRVEFTDTAITTGVGLTPSGTAAPGQEALSSAPVDLIDLGLDFNVGADGLLRLEFWETFVDFPSPQVDGTWGWDCEDNGGEPGSTCCSAQTDGGCDDPDCEALICGMDMFCCDVAWDEICADLANDPDDGCEVCQDTGPPPLENDDCEDAIAINVSPGGSEQVFGSTSMATFDNVGTCGTSNTAPGVWYSVTGTGNNMTATTCTDFFGFDTKITVFCGNCDTLICVGGNDDSCVGGASGLLSTVNWCSEEGAEYLILVHGFSSATGDFDLIVSDSGTPCSGAIPCEVIEVPNDDCEDAIALDVPPGGSDEVFGSTAQATFDDVGTCGTSNTAPGVWYSVTGTGNNMTATTCTDFFGFDTKISVFCGDCPANGNGTTSNCCTAHGGIGCDDPDCQALICGQDAFCCDVAWDGLCAGAANTQCAVCQSEGGLTCVGGNDDSCVGGASGLLSTVNWCSQEGAEYLILVHGFSSATGAFDLIVSDSGTPCTGAVQCLPPEATGACCDCDGPDIICAVLSEGECDAAGGTYLGDGTSCVEGEELTFTSNPNAAIPDVNPTGVSDTISVPKSFSVVDVSVDVDITHTWRGDLCVILEHNGTSVTLVQRIGADGLGCNATGCCGNANNDINACLNDSGGNGPINAATQVGWPAGCWTPENPLSAFDGMDAAGDWTLTVIDNAALDIGTFNSWSISFVQPGGTSPCEGVVDCDDPVAGEGCSLGFWKNHPELWVDFAPDDLFSSVFADAFPGLTLLEVISQPSGPPAPGAPPQLRNLGKQAVAALLNSTSVNFGMTTQEVIDAFNAAFAAWQADGNHQHLTNQQGEFGELNSQGCPDFNSADIAGDMQVGVNDLLILLSEWGNRKSVADITGDGIVNADDLLLLLSNWGAAPVEWTPFE